MASPVVLEKTVAPSGIGVGDDAAQPNGQLLGRLFGAQLQDVRNLGQNGWQPRDPGERRRGRGGGEVLRWRPRHFKVGIIEQRLIRSRLQKAPQIDPFVAANLCQLDDARTNDAGRVFDGNGLARFDTRRPGR